MNSLYKEKKITFGIVEDQISFRSNLAELIKTYKQTGEVIEFSSAEELLIYPFLTKLDFLIVDYKLKGKDGILLLGEKSIQNLSIPKLILTSFDAEGKIFEALKFGATGYMFKDELYSLNSILEVLLNGGAFISPTIAFRVVNFFKEIKKSSEGFEELTKREDEILKGLSSGLSPKEISEKLNIDVTTVRCHIRNIYKKLEVNNQIQLLQKVKDKNFI